MKPAVFDANIFIDMLHAELFPDFLKLRYVKYAPPDVIEEIQEAKKHLLFDAIDSGRVNVPIIEDLTPIVELKKRHPPLSFQDCACLHLAMDFRAILVTGEKPLRTIAGSTYKLEVHGSTCASMRFSMFAIFTKAILAVLRLSCTSLNNQKLFFQVEPLRLEGREGVLLDRIDRIFRIILNRKALRTLRFMGFLLAC